MTNSFNECQVVYAVRKINEKIIKLGNNVSLQSTEFKFVYRQGKCKECDVLCHSERNRKRSGWHDSGAPC